MSSMMREGSRSRGNYPNYSGIMRRMVSLPRSILGSFSRAVGELDLMGRGDRRNQMYPAIMAPPQPPPPLLSPHFPAYPPPYDSTTAMLNDEWAFLNSFEQNYGTTHPFFYACRFVQALKIAQDEKKFLFLYLHSPDHPFAADFCRETLCSEVVVQFLDANFVSWGALADRGEGVHVGGLLRPASFPFCALIAPASGDNIAVLQQLEGPVSPADLLELLQTTLEEQGVAFGSARSREEEKRRADRRLREEQDVAYLAALSLDQERERIRNSPQEQTVEKPVAPSPAPVSVSAPAPAPAEASDEGSSQLSRRKRSLIKPSKVKDKTTTTTTGDDQCNDSARKSKDNQVTQILIRFPNGERRSQSFAATDKVKAIYRFIDSQGLPGIDNYRLISSFPRKVYGTDQMSKTLKEAGLHPKATLFLDLV